jgi:hypothetical protein
VYRPSEYRFFFARSKNMNAWDSFTKAADKYNNKYSRGGNPSSWRCTACSFVNDSLRVACGACGGERPRSASSSSAPSYSDSSSPSSYISSSLTTAEVAASLKRPRPEDACTLEAIRPAPCMASEYLPLPPATVALGRTGLFVSAVGLGTLPLGVNYSGSG